MKVSVCIPTYERVDYLQQLLKSISEQSYDQIEICISDDSESDNVRRLAHSMELPNLRYMPNSYSRGLWTNLRNALSMATGEIAIIMGDDDKFTDSDSIKAYVDAAVIYPEAKVFYSNQIQIDEKNIAQLVHRHFDTTVEFAPGLPAIEKLWYRSVQIAGLALILNTPNDISTTFPDRPTLYPQMIAVANILEANSAVGIAKFACSVRGHQQQLGALAAQELRVISSEESMAWEEIFHIIHNMAIEKPSTFGMIEPKLEKQALYNVAGALPYIRINAGNKALKRVVTGVRQSSMISKKSWWFYLLYLGILVAPLPFLTIVRKFLKQLQISVKRRLMQVA